MSNYEIDSSEDEDVSELEVILTDPSCDFGTLRTVCKGKPVHDKYRKDVWRICLNMVNDSGLSDFDDLFDLPEQLVIRADCQTVVDSLGADKVSSLSDLESIITCFSKFKKIPYSSNNGWLDILKVLLTLHLPKAELFAFFNSLVNRYIPVDVESGGNCYHLFRLLVLYHDPELCTLLDTKKITPDMFADGWFKSMFSSVCSHDVLLPLWDVYFQRADAFFIFFMSLVILINAKEQLMEMINDSKHEIIDKLKQFPAALDAEDIEDFCSLAQYYVSKTPHSFKKLYNALLFHCESDFQFNRNLMPNIAHLLCLPVSIAELMQANQLGVGTVRYFLVDCRPAEQYNAGHLPTAFHLDANLMLQNSQEFNTAVDALFETQKHSIATGSEAGGQHLCFVGSGREQEDQYVFMVIAQFLQRKHQYISMAKGGYKAIHKLLEDNLDTSLQGHFAKRCVECNPNLKLDLDSGSESDQFDTLMHRLSGLMKEKGSQVKHKVIDYIRNDPTTERHVSSSDRIGKPYRSLGSVFTIAGDEEDDEDDEIASLDENIELVSLTDWLAKPDIKHRFTCQYLARVAGPPAPSHLLISDTHMFILKELPEKDGVAAVIARRPLQYIVKITSKKKDCRIISFKHGTISDSGDKETISAVDKVFIDDAGEATKIIKQQITKIWENLDE